MPHFHVDYSTNLEERLSIADLLVAIRDAAMETGIFPLAGIRVRATACDHWVIADGNPDHAFLDISVRLRAGRPDEAKKRATRDIFSAVETFCAEAMANSSLMLSLEMRDIDPELSPKASSIRNYLPGASQ